MATATDNELKSLCIDHFILRGKLDDVSVKIRKILIEKGIKTRDACQSIERDLKSYLFEGLSDLEKGYYFNALKLLSVKNKTPEQKN
jgi:hypothetical protein